MPIAPPGRLIILNGLGFPMELKTSKVVGYRNELSPEEDGNSTVLFLRLENIPSYK